MLQYAILRAFHTNRFSCSHANRATGAYARRRIAIADPRITSVEVHEYTYTLSDLGKDYDGFNLVYEPGGASVQRAYIIRIGTDVGLVGEYAILLRLYAFVECHRA